MTIYLSLLIAIVGVVVYLMTSHAKAAEVGRLMFWTGLLAFLLKFGIPIIAH
jgi:hypothetical protein